jgi:hypothetical protein
MNMQTNRVVKFYGVLIIKPFGEVKISETIHQSAKD